MPSTGSLLLAFQKCGWLQLWVFWELGFCFFGIISLWSALEQLNWKNYVKTIPDIASADFISIFCWDTSSRIELFAPTTAGQGGVLCGSTKQFWWVAALDVHWIAAHLLPLLSLSWVQVLSFHCDTLGSCWDWVRAALKLWVGPVKRSENSENFYASLPSRDTFFTVTRSAFALTELQP